ncbi:D-2-hydroxyacid dehydrogenase [Ancylobacter sp. A5.8]|uniref:D-2-hydroxyacid dehydrogenase n=1 Tax=Ancylobacter gelatini TaxID=2919920 RepID=UPI001F4D8BB6|nr:D-2-hydroxyacid dehydrogenase [Ancylobacter gelatini]MCJ8143697.1 D-2-hydroxyacid dehydrogenase [Ancylobacter gelatini]
MSNGTAPPRHHVVMLDTGALPDGATLRRPRLDCDWRTYDDTAPGEIVERAREATILLVSKVALSAATLAQLPKLRMVAVAATGTDHVDLRACAARGILVSNVRGYATHAVPEHTFALMLALQRNIGAYAQAVARGRWSEATQFCFVDYPIRDLAGSTLGLIGRGELGGAVAALAGAFGMKVLHAGRKGVAALEDAASGEGRTPFAEVLARSDIISLHCPLTPETQGLIGRAEFALMARRPLLINTARGGLIDEAALIEAVESGRISGVGLDVASAEPMPAHHPLMAIAGRPNVIITPHVAWASREAIQALADGVIANVEAFMAGQPRNLVAPA